jgi:uncharacterized protein
MFDLTPPGEPALHNETAFSLSSPPVQPAHSRIEAVWEQIKGRVAPVWPLEDYVAVNPFMGLTHYSFMQAHHLLLRKGYQDILLSWADYQKAYAEGVFTDADLTLAMQAPSSTESLVSVSLAELQHYLTTGFATVRKPHYDRLSEWMDFHQRTHWDMLIQDEVFRYCAAHYDQGFAPWRSPWADLSLYESWIAQAKYDKRLEKLGFTRLCDYLQQLPASPLVAIEAVLNQMGVPTSDWEDVLYTYLLSINGWAAWIQYQQRSGQGNDSDLCGLLAIRLIYEWALWRNSPYVDWPAFQAAVFKHEGKASEGLREKQQKELNTQDQARYLCQQAMELAYQRQLFSKIAEATAPVQGKIEAQFVFCIDVRSERISRHLEQVSPAIETFGFAGFFGMPIAYRALGDSAFVKQCPAPLEPLYQLEATVEGDAEDVQQARAQGLKQRLLKKTWKQFKSSAVSCFTFIESLGLSYTVQLLADSLGVLPQTREPKSWVPDVEGPLGLSLEQQVAMATGMLTQLGLLRDFAPLVVLCGHGSTVQNNPHQAAYDCGACCGHSGAPNALTAAKILNHPEVRAALARQHILIPEETFFLAALHDTTRDEIQFLNTQHLPAHHRLAQLEQWVLEAGKNTLEERARLMNTDAKRLLRRSTDWSEQRPEWGLAGNAAFVIGKRSSTYRQDLEGRAFLHHYRHEDDANGVVLEGIMTAPMIVSNWINLQYYASSVSPQLYSSGNKILHNIVGNIGVIEGNSGDLKTGLPLQSVHNGQDLQYLPLRLSVVIEAPRERIARILDRQEGIAELVNNEWLSLFAFDHQQFYRYHRGTWLLAKS